MSKHILVVMTNPADGPDEEFNEWYSNTHVQEVVVIPGFVSAQRFKLSAEQAGGTNEYDYLAIYEIEAESAGAALRTEGLPSQPEHERRTGRKTGVVGVRPDY